MSETNTELEAATFRRLREHLMQQRPDVQNIDLMILAGNVALLEKVRRLRRTSLVQAARKK